MLCHAFLSSPGWLLYKKSNYFGAKRDILNMLLHNSKSNYGGLYNCQTKHLLAETAGQNFFFPKTNRPFTRKKASRTNHKDALTAELRRKTVNGMAGVMVITALRGRCIPSSAHSAAGKPKFPLGPHPTGLYIARTAINPEIVVETDINSASAPAGDGRGLLLNSPPMKCISSWLVNFIVAMVGNMRSYIWYAVSLGHRRRRLDADGTDVASVMHKAKKRISAFLQGGGILNVYFSLNAALSLSRTSWAPPSLMLAADTRVSFAFSRSS